MTESILNVADLLSNQKIFMGVGVLSKKGGGYIPGLVTHKKGIDFNLQYVFDDGAGGGISKFESYKAKGYSREKTYQMLKAFIDSGRSEIKRIHTNDKELNKQLKDYASQTYGIDLDISSLPYFDNKILVGFRE